MKTRITLIIAALFMATNFSFAQQDEECMLNLTLMNDYVKTKKYDEAYEPWMKVRNKCPKFNIALYKYGEKILDHKIDNSSGAEKVAFIEDYMVLLDKAREYYSSKYELGEVLERKGVLMYENQKDLNINDKKIYDTFHDAYMQDLPNFTNTKGLYVYFTKTVDLFNAGEFELQSVFDKYDDVNEQLENLNEKYAKALNEIILKEERGEALGKKEKQYKKYYQAKIEANGKVAGSLDTYLGQLANCENLIPLYQKDFPTYKTDAVWLKRAVSRMYNKECTDDPLYIELVKAYDATAPSADTKYFVANVLYKQGKNSEGDKYIREAYELETDTFKKSKLAKRIANAFKKRGSYGTARTYYREALKLNPSDGTPHLRIASMYADSAKNCGDSNFNKRAVFWYAAQEALKAGQVDPSLKSTASKTAASYNANAPTKAEIFTAGNAGETITIGCWMGGSVRVPSL
ncbi:hypothetical protein SAMN04515667_0913 [Formosa sp. Hel1_31_208]|uniref:tetratricopeptide repeat protein n=1 Tax=Formosa sp. Hel1_31_208 TaxID=1798225 RepID=UPI00087DE503|nr:hypothetical protein [Formosa sp. Hel1_31_208]SDR88657.1 hypothetical protein SAMN04515667_0913 [Formosa sp. Hel1_31_208]